MMLGLKVGIVRVLRPFSILRPSLIEIALRIHFIFTSVVTGAVF